MKSLAQQWDEFDELLVEKIKLFAPANVVQRLEQDGGPLVYWESEALVALLIDAIQGKELVA